jgi:hypothetical protein
LRKAGVFILIKTAPDGCIAALLTRPALSLEGERSDIQAGLLAYSHRLPLLPG